MPGQLMRLSLIIPCYNEARSLPSLAARCGELTAADPDIEVILVDNGSTDDTPAIMTQALAGKANVRSVRVVKNTGYGAGILAGLAEANGDILGWTHADLQTDPMDVLTAFNVFKAADQPDLLFVKGLRYGRRLADVVFTQGMSVFETILLSRPLRDINAQPNLFPRDLYEHWGEAPTDFSLDLFAYASAKSRGLKVERFPVLFAPRVHGVSSWNVDWSAKRRFIRRTVDFSFRLRRTLAESGRR
jgi:polyisoprenyl-phosphate glycosyltransferase